MINVFNKYRNSNDKKKADVPPMSNWVIEIAIAGSSSVMRDRMLRGAMNLPPEAYKILNFGCKGHANDVCWHSIIPPLTTLKNYIRTSKMRSCLSCTLDEQRSVFDPGGLSSITKITSSGVLCMDENRMRF